MNQALINGINNTVGENDVLWHLGDFTFGGIDKIWEFRKQIKCKKINLILGNHDHHIENDKILPNVIRKEPYSQELIDGNPKDYYVTTPEDGEYPNYVSARSLFNSVNYVKQTKINGQSFFFSHYAHRIWDKSHHGKIHLYGHSHDTLDKTGEEWGKSMDVGVDAAKRILGEYSPFSFDEVMEIMNKREINIIDHHNSQTN